MPSVRDKLKDKTTKLADDRPASGERALALVEQYEEGSFYKVPTDIIKPNPNQPRKIFNEESLKELADSIRTKGVLQPVIIKRNKTGDITLVAGERRFRAARLAGLEEIPAVLTHGDPDEIALIENLQREDLKPIEEAEALERIMASHEYTQEKLAEIVGKARTTITEILALNKLPDQVKDECRTSDIPKSVLMEITKQETDEDMIALFEQVKDGRLRTRQVRKITRSPRVRRGQIDITIERMNHLREALEKLDMETIGQREKKRFARELQDLLELITRLVKDGSK